jgi:hypothetical protein
MAFRASSTAAVCRASPLWWLFLLRLSVIRSRLFPQRRRDGFYRFHIDDSGDTGVVPFAFGGEGVGNALQLTADGIKTIGNKDEGDGQVYTGIFRFSRRDSCRLPARAANSAPFALRKQFSSPWRRQPRQGRTTSTPALSP